MSVDVDGDVITQMTYSATVTREGNMWLAEVPGLPGAHAYARTLTNLRTELADAIILAADLDDDADVGIAFALTADAHHELIARAFTLAEQRSQIRAAESAMIAETAGVARSLIAAGWSVRDTAGALDVTPGRVSQLVKP